MNILIGGAWPYANGSLHIGHIAALLPGDVIARFYRQNGYSVKYISGTDCHGTPITLKAKKEGVSPEEISEYYHNEFVKCFDDLGFSYDHYGKTSSNEHKDFVMNFHRKLYESNSIEEKTSKQCFCEFCNRFLPDRFVNGICPNCGEDTRGDQCEKCNAVFDSSDLKYPTCAICSNKVTLKPSKHLYLKLSDFQDKIKDNIDESTWRKNAISLTNRYISEGLKDRALTRDIDFGIDVPKKGYEDKKIYIWAENVLGYLSGCYISCLRTGENFDNYFKNEDSFHYYVHGKDNIPFHSVILPALLLCEGGYHLPDAIISSEYMTLDGQKISTSKDHAVWIKDLIEKYNIDAIRYFFTINGPEKRDGDFSYREFINSNNGELLGVYGNFVNRTLVFIEKYLEKKTPKGKIDEGIKDKIENLFKSSFNEIKKGNLKDALNSIMDLARFSNKYFDTKRPWITRNTDIKECEDTIFNCVQLIANLAVLFEPFIPFSSNKIFDILKIEKGWSLKIVKEGIPISKTEILFERIEAHKINK